MKLLESLFTLSMTLFIFRNPMVQPAMAQKEFFRFSSLLADKYLALLFFLNHLYCIFLHSVIKLQQLDLVLMEYYRLLLGSFRHIDTSFLSSSGRFCLNSHEIVDG
jgi:hypothetical protein